MVPWEYLWPTLRCRREAGKSPHLSIGWWYLSSLTTKRHCCRVSAADKGCRIYPLDPHPDTVVLYSGCTPGKRRTCYLPDDRHPASLVGLRGGWRHARTKILRLRMDAMLLCPGKGLVLPKKPNVGKIATNVRFLLIPLRNVEISKTSPFAIHKALIGIGGEPKSVKRLRSGDLLIETLSALQTKSFLLANTFLDSSVTISRHNSLNTSRGVIPEPDLLNTPESEILEVYSDQGVIQVRTITIKKDATIIPTKHLILTFNSPILPPTIKANYLNCKTHPYIPNPLHCFKCQRFGHSQTSCRGQLDYMCICWTYLHRLQSRA
ncbi:putative RNA-directed DNA polymerase from transposon BS [Trichonephila clavipes]|nr:putative RNA-directed DNA polymerase from transposon BS [Trichonephila clavipes]